MNRFLVKSLPVSAIALAMFLSGCSTPTSMLSAWADPTAKEKFSSGGKVLAAYPINEPTMRKTVEDRLSKWVKNSVPSYTVLDESALKDTEKARKDVEAAGFDFVVILRVADFKQETRQDSTVSWHDSTPYYTYWGYTAYAYDVGAYFSRGYTIMDTTIDVETTVFEVASGKLLFASRTRLKEPGTTDQIIDEVVIAVKDTLRGAGMIQ